MPATKIRPAERVTGPEPEPEAAEPEPEPEPEPMPAPVSRRGWLPSVAEQTPWYYLGLAAVAGVGVVDWPVAVTIGVTYYLVRRKRVGV